MAEFPSGIYSPRTKENKSGVVYDATKRKILFAEDLTKLDEEVVAIETFLSPKLLTLRPEINIDEVKKNLVPDQVQVGVAFGYSMPIYAADNEELYFKQHVLHRWDEASNIRSKIIVCLANAEDVGDKFKFQLSWEHTPQDGVVPVTSHDVEVEQAVLTGRNAQYSVYVLTFTLDYDIEGEGNEVKVGETLNVRLRRIAAAAPQITNEIIVLDWIVEYQRDKFGGAF